MYGSNTWVANPDAGRHGDPDETPLSLSQGCHPLRGLKPLSYS